MTTKTIAQRLNQIAVQNGHDIANLQVIRNSRFKTIFSGHTVFDDYLFHTGGRTEIQFNVGADRINGADVVRYGLAFSFQKGINLKNPIETLTPRVYSFNSYIAAHAADFSDAQMWYHWNDEQGHRVFDNPLDMGKIPSEWISVDNFIFLGKFFKKGLADIRDADLEQILAFFDRLLPVYRYVEGNVAEKAIVANKISKICWNTNGWKRPSGLSGKSNDKKSHENKNGYGHEEWLFDFDKLIDGYHYAFLQPINKYWDRYIGNTYNIALYTVDSESNTWYWVAEIKNATIIDKDEDRRILGEYRRAGWLDEMINDLDAVAADSENYKKWINDCAFNLKFKHSDVHWYDDKPVEFAPDEHISHTRYTLLNRSLTPSAAKSVDRSLRFGANKPKDTTPLKRRARQTEMEYSRLHNQLQNALLEWLNQQFPDATDIGNESPIGRARVDVALKKRNGHVTLYEVKTYATARESIRQALGQLLEYSHYPDQTQGDDLVVVSHAPLDADSRQYIAHLRHLYSLPFRYMQFDHNKKEILEET